MASVMQKVAGQARRTFRLSSLDQTFKENIRILTSLVEDVTVSDLNLKPRNTGKTAPHSSNHGSAPVTYMHIWEDEYFTMGIFLLKHGSRIPLHDHPGMHGLLKILYGNIHVRCYDKVDSRSLGVPEISGGFYRSKYTKNLIPGKFASEQLLDSESGAFELGSNEKNYHDIEAVDGPAAFLDILGPPYDPDGGRDCTYYRELEGLSVQDQSKLSAATPAASVDGDVRWLQPIPQPRDFWCGYEEYPGPKVGAEW
ncbi:2-aminoethanethiol dioxygenase-like [Glandiceps talaboti]